MTSALPLYTSGTSLRARDPNEIFARSPSVVNLAVSLSQQHGLRVGLLDVDVFGPSIPTMMNLHGAPDVNEVRQMVPMENHGVRCMSMGFLMEKDAPAVWRGPMVMSAVEKLMFSTDWGRLDVLMVSTGTGRGKGVGC